MRVPLRLRAATATAAADSEDDDDDEAGRNVLVETGELSL